MLTTVNAAVLGVAGYIGFQKRDEIKNWDRRLLASIAVGIATFVGGEGYVSWQVYTYAAISPARLPRSSSRSKHISCGPIVHGLNQID